MHTSPLTTLLPSPARHPSFTAQFSPLVNYAISMVGMTERTTVRTGFRMPFRRVRETFRLKVTRWIAFRKKELFILDRGFTSEAPMVPTALGPKPLWLVVHRLLTEVVRFSAKVSARGA